MLKLKDLNNLKETVNSTLKNNSRNPNIDLLQHS